MAAPDLFAQLIPASWRGVVFQTTQVSHVITHDMAQHKRPHRDGARVESTGRNPQMFSWRCVFFNTVSATDSERNDSEAAFPTRYVKFLGAMADRSQGILAHPLFGDIKCKPVSMSTVLAANVRDGAYVDAEWIEDTDSEEESGKILSKQSAIAEATALAADLDSYVAGNPIIRDPGDPFKAGVSLEDSMFAIKGVFDKVSLISKRIGGKIDALKYRVDSIGDSISSVKSPQLWPAKQTAKRMSAALSRILFEARQREQSLSRYIVPNDSTVGGLAGRVRSTTSQLIALNPDLASSTIVKRGTVVRYYKSP